MRDVRSCENCRHKNYNNLCYALVDDGIVRDLPPSRICSLWIKLRCPSCGGILSEIRYQNGRRLRHCYSCHFEFPVVMVGRAVVIKEDDIQPADMWEVLS